MEALIKIIVKFLNHHHSSEKCTFNLFFIFSFDKFHFMENPVQLLYYKARVAEKIERFDDVIKIMNEIIKIHPGLNGKERTLFFNGYNKIMNSFRKTIQTCFSYIYDETNEQKKRCLIELSNKYIEILEKYCKDAISTIDNILLLESLENEACIFYQKMRADSLRYIAEIKYGPERKEYAKQSELSYKAALTLALKYLRKSNPLFLTLALNYSVCQYDLLNNHEEAILFAEKIFNDGVKILDELVESDYEKATSTLKIIRENINQWKID